MTENQFISLVPRLRQVALTAAVGAGSDADGAEDVAQDTMIRLWQLLAALERVESPEALTATSPVAWLSMPAVASHPASLLPMPSASLPLRFMPSPMSAFSTTRTLSGSTVRCGACPQYSSRSSTCVRSSTAATTR
ncbi:rNA polymerase sigma-24 subunit ECF subfamily [Prevotella sp. CAG:474]|nr:rNA polymerase sigma-24 subunit ECF subfamily [Prevotella sp. CAG:474]